MGPLFAIILALAGIVAMVGMVMTGINFGEAKAYAIEHFRYVTEAERGYFFFPNGMDTALLVTAIIAIIAIIALPVILTIYHWFVEYPDEGMIHGMLGAAAALSASIAVICLTCAFRNLGIPVQENIGGEKAHFAFTTCMMIVGWALLGYFAVDVVYWIGYESLAG